MMYKCLIFYIYVGSQEVRIVGDILETICFL